MVVIRSGDNRQGVCPLKFLQEVWQRHFLEKIQIEGRTFYPPKQAGTSQFNSTSIATLRGHLSDSKNISEKNINIKQPKPDILSNKTYCQAEFHSNINSYSAQGFLGRSKLASYPLAKCEQYKVTPDLVRSSVSNDGGNGLDHDLNLDKERIYIFKDDNTNIIKMNDTKTPDVLWFTDNSTANSDNQKVLRRKILARNLIPISSSTRPLGLPSSCSPSHYQRKLSRFRYRNIKNITSLSRPLLIG